MGENYGIQNEYDFIDLFNDKFLYELDEKSQLFLKDIFEDNIDSEDKIIAWKNKMFQKTDIFIKYKNYTKKVSLKCGNNNSVHQEAIQDFKRYLEKLEIPYKIIDYYMCYHYGYMRDENGRNDYSRTLSSDEYKELYQNDIDTFNKAINKTRIIIDMIDRFIIYGKNCDFAIDALVCGTTDDYVWIKRDNLYDLILSKKSYEHTSPHIACLTIGPKSRNLAKKEEYKKERYIVTIRWSYIKESIINFKKIIADGALNDKEDIPSFDQ